MESQTNWYCSRECYRYFIKENLEAECNYCFNRYSKRDSASKYCSRTCSNKSRRGIKYDRLRNGCKIQLRDKQRMALINRDGDKCLHCNILPEWNGKSLKFQIDHIDGNRKNNDLENLRLLCPNCHSQTETWTVPKSRLISN